MRARGRVARKGRGCMEREMVQPAPSPQCPRVRAKGMRARRGITQVGEPRVNRRVGAPKRGCERVTVRPRVHARGRVCEQGGVQLGWGTAGKQKGGRTKAGAQKG